MRNVILKPMKPYKPSASPRRRIAVVTGTRADYGLLKPLMTRLQNDGRAELQLCATGSHLSARHGRTVNAIKADGFKLSAEVPARLGKDDAAGLAMSLGSVIQGFAKAFGQLHPDMVVLLGDRWEMLGAASSALMLRLPMAHIHGGEATEGLIDEAIRHSLTKMAHLHFAAAPVYRRRILQLGESPRRVFTVGGLGVDAMQTTPILSRSDLEKRLGLAWRKETYVVTFHPVTLRPETAKRDMLALLSALAERKDAAFVFTLPGAEAESQEIVLAIQAFVAAHPGHAVAHASLGMPAYVSAMRHSYAVVGNSSSGLLEAPSLGIPTINIGDRQRGRLRAKSVIDCSASLSSIRQALNQASQAAFRRSLGKVKNPYGDGGAAKRIAETLLTFPLNNLLDKRFHDL